MFYKKHLVIAISFLIPLVRVWSQFPEFPRAAEYLDGKNVHTVVQNGGDMFRGLNGKSQYIVPVPANLEDGKHSNSIQNFWIGGIDQNNQLRVAAQTYRFNGSEFYPGPVRTNGIYPGSQSDITFMGGAMQGDIFYLSDGRILFTHQNWFSIYDPISGAIINRSLPSDWITFKTLQMGDGRILFTNRGPYVSTTSVVTLVADTSTWTVTPYITPNKVHNKPLYTALADGRVLITSLQGAEIINPYLNTVDTINPMPFPAENSVSKLLHNGRVLVTLGYDYNLSDSLRGRYSQLYDPASNSWIPGPVLQTFRREPILTLLPDSTVLISGSNVHPELLEFYHPNTNTVTSFTLPYPYRVREHGALLDNDNEIYFFPDPFSISNHLKYIWKFNYLTYAVSKTQIESNGSRVIHLGNNKALIGRGGVAYQFFDTQKDELVHQRFQKIWKVSRSEIDLFRSDFNNGTVDFDKYKDIGKWPAYGNLSYGESGYLAPFVDVNGDGEYKPGIDGDYPCIRGDNALWWVFNDDAGPHHETGGAKLGIQVEVMAYTFDCDVSPCPDTFVDYSTFFHYKITNRSQWNLHDTWVGIFSSSMIGNISDDYIGCDTTLDLAFTYNADNDDQTALGYGLNPPAFGTQFLKTPSNLGMSVFRSTSSDLGPNSYPTISSEYYQLLQPLFLDGQHIVNNGLDGYPGTASGPQTNFMYSGNPGSCGPIGSGWSELSAGNPLNPRYYIQSAGPFNLNAGATTELDYAVLWARDNSNLESVCRLKELAANVQPWWTTLNNSSCQLVSVGIEDPVYTSRPGPLTLSPNPTNGRVEIRLPEMLVEGQITIWNAIGQQVYQEKWIRNALNASLDLEHLPAGIYQVLVTGEQQKYSGKLVIER